MTDPANKKLRQKDFLVDPDSFDIEELVFRVMTFDPYLMSLAEKIIQKT